MDDKLIKHCDLKNGEYYVANSGNIFMFNKNEEAYYYLGSSQNLPPNQTFEINGGGFKNNSNRHATLEEKHWLKECIKYNKFITLKDAMKTFNNELQYEIC